MPNTCRICETGKPADVAAFPHCEVCNSHHAEGAFDSGYFLMQDGSIELVEGEANILAHSRSRGEDKKQTFEDYPFQVFWTRDALQSEMASKLAQPQLVPAEPWRAPNQEEHDQYERDITAYQKELRRIEKKLDTAEVS